MTYSRYGFQDSPLLYSKTAMPPGTASGTSATMIPLYEAPDTASRSDGAGVCRRHAAAANIAAPISHPISIQTVKSSSPATSE